MKSNLDFARGLAIKADNDFKAAQIGLDHGAPLDTVCFHLQQAAEKLLKAALACRNKDYPLTHDIRDLLTLAAPEFPSLTTFRELLAGFSRYAVRMRYDAGMYPDREEALAAFEAVKQLRSVIHSVVPPEVLP